MTGVIAARPADLDVLSTVVASAFHDAPPSAWLIADQAARRRLFPGYFRILIEHALAAGLVCTTPGRDAAALWIPVTDRPPAPPARYAGRLAAATAPWTDWFVAFDSAVESRHPAGTAHHHLALLGVRPDRQGHGIGTALLDTADRHTGGSSPALN